VGRQEDVFVARSTDFAPEHRALAEKLGWHDFVRSAEGGPYAFKDGRYKAAESYQYNDGEDVGIQLIFIQDFNKDHLPVWHVNQDLVLVLRLLQEGDSWVRPDEGYVEVIRQRRDASGMVVAIEIKREFLRDYLAARGLALRLGYYRQRMAIVEDASYLEWRNEPCGYASPTTGFSRQCSKLMSKVVPMAEA
jgi:hypothetical protein